jgi:2-dehydropantoate 2-reductase
MKIAVFGAGAVGGLIAARLLASGCAVSIVARGATLAALRANGLQLQADGVALSLPVAAGDAAALGMQDVVILAIKATQLAAAAESIAPLIGPHTLLITAMNGVPWWFFERPDLPHAGLRLPSLMAGARLAQLVPPDRLAGCVVHLSASCPAPGQVRLAFGNRLLLGAAGAQPPVQLDATIALLRSAGFDAQASADIRTDIWYKLWGNMTLNPVSVLTGASADRILDDPLVRRFCLDAMREAATIGEAIGCPIAQSGEDRLDVARQLGSFRTSMLQDAAGGRPLEIDALVTVVHDIGQAVGIATPCIDSLLGLIRLHARTFGLYPE